LRLLLVDDDASLRALLRTTFEVFEIEVVEAANAAEARHRIDEHRPDVVVLDVLMPGIDGIAFCRELKSDPLTEEIGVVLLSGAETGAPLAANGTGADAFVTKPFSPLELLAVVERLAGATFGVPFRSSSRAGAEEQLILYARDLRHLLQLEREQRALVQRAYQETVSALAGVLDSKDTVTGAHSERVRRYALELARRISPALADDPAAEYGFLLHDVGKIGIPDVILQKPGPLEPDERARMETHTVIGEQMLADVALLAGAGLEVVRSHHERWDGGGYPDRLSGEAIPLGARVFAVADTLDAITSDRPYRNAGPWDDARAVIVAERGRQFDPDVVDAFRDADDVLYEVKRELES
jgi:response regulator RpfG family c-di-GMP phosphodiesterase